MKLYCNSCKKETNHAMLAKHELHHRDEYVCNEHYHICECKGCNNIVFLYEFYDLEGGYPLENNGWHVPKNSSIYPDERDRLFYIENIYDIPVGLREIYKETIDAYKNKSYILSSVGCRAIIEVYCNELGIEGTNLENKISNLRKQGEICKSDEEILHGIRFLGNDAVHDNYKPKKEALGITMKILSEMLNKKYTYTNQAKRHLDVLSDNFDSFLIDLKEKLSELSVGEEKNLREIFGKEFRKYQNSYSTLVEKLKSVILNGSFTGLKIGKVEVANGMDIQLFILA